MGWSFGSKCAARWTRRSAVLLLSLLFICLSGAPAQQSPPPTTIRVTSRLVFLDVTVLDKKGRPVVSGLSKDDFSITEDKKPQRIFSFEEPQSHVVDLHASDDNPGGKAPLTIVVLDLLNSEFQDFAYIRYCVRKYLMAQPEQLGAPAELMVLGNEDLELVQGYTRSRADLLYALDHLPTALPYKMMNADFYPERFGQSIDALQQIALQNGGLPGRKNIVWVGHGGPSIFTEDLPEPMTEDLNRYARDTTNMLVNARVSLFVIYPRLRVNGGLLRMSEMSADSDIGDDDDPFSGDINFGVFVNETGGKLFFNRNDIDHEMASSLQLGSQYYTLTYQPAEGDANSKFRRIRVTLRDPNLHALTKAGYFAPEKGNPVDPRQKTLIDLTEAARASIPFQALHLTVENVVRHPDTRSVEVTVRLQSRSIVWEPAANGTSTANLTLAAVSLAASRDILTSRLESRTLTASTQDPAQLAILSAALPVTIRFPRKARSVRVAIQTEESDRIGAAEVDRKTIDAAPAAPTPPPKLIPRPAYRPAYRSPYQPPAPPPAPPQ